MASKKKYFHGQPLSILFPMTGDLIGGSVISTSLLARELVRRGHDVKVAMQGEGPALDHVMAMKIPHVMMKPLPPASKGRKADGFRWANIQAIPEAARVIRACGADIVHANEIRTLRTWPMAAYMARRRLVVHWRSNYKSNPFVNLSFRLASEVIVLSRQNLSPLPATAKTKARIVLNPFELEKEAELQDVDRSALRQSLGLPIDAAIIGVFGSLIARKRPHALADLVASMPMAPDGRPVIGLVCGGRMDPHDVKLDERLADPAIASRMILTGHVKGSEKWIKACDLVIVPAEDEPFGRTAIEAAAAGVPTIVSDRCGVCDVLRDGVNSIILPLEPAERWVEEARKILGDPDFRERIVVAGRALTQILTPEVHTDVMEKVYSDVMAR